MSSALLEFEQVSLPRGDYDVGLTDVSLALHPGGVMVVLVDMRSVYTPLCDIAQGLLEPETGAVRYEGTDWRNVSPDEQSVRRGAIGRIFPANSAWLSNLDVDENVTLRVRHRARRSDQEIYAEARALAATLGLSEWPERRPPMCSRELLQGCQIVRALLDAPKLILAEFATYSLEPAVKERFLTELNGRISAGAALIWLTVDPGERNLFGAGARCYRYESAGVLKEWQE